MAAAIGFAVDGPVTRDASNPTGVAETAHRRPIQVRRVIPGSGPCGEIRGVFNQAMEAEEAS
jgi:hypothetical protein